MLNTIAIQHIDYDLYAPGKLSGKAYVNHRIRAFRAKGKIVARIQNLQLMEQQQEEQALQFSLLIDSLMSKARQELQIALQESLMNISQLAVRQLRGKADQTSEDLIAVASQQRIVVLSRYLQQELTKYLGSPIEQCFVMANCCVQMPTTKELQTINREYQMTLFWSETMVKAMNKAYQEALSACLPMLAGKLAEKFDMGANCLSMVTCQPVSERARCLSEIQKRMQGLVRSYFLRLEYELTSSFAKRAYQLFNEYIKKRAAWKHEHIQRRPLISCSPKLLPAV